MEPQCQLAMHPHLNVLRPFKKLPPSASALAVLGSHHPKKRAVVGCVLGFFCVNN